MVFCAKFWLRKSDNSSKKRHWGRFRTFEEVMIKIKFEVLFSTFGEDLELSNFCGKSFLNFGLFKTFLGQI